MKDEAKGANEDLALVLVEGLEAVFLLHECVIWVSDGALKFVQLVVDEEFKYFYVLLLARVEGQREAGLAEFWLIFHVGERVSPYFQSSVVYSQLFQCLGYLNLFLLLL